MTIGWIVVYHFSSGAYQVLASEEDRLVFTSKVKQAYIFRNKELAENSIRMLQDNTNIEIVPVEVYL